MTLRELETTLSLPLNPLLNHLTEAAPLVMSESLANRMEPPSLAAGQVIGRYELISLLGRGSMGSVWKAMHLRLQCERAIKIIYLDSNRLRELSRRFELEARSLAKLANRRTVAVHDMGTEGVFGLIETELLQGVTLNQLPGGGEPRPIRWVLDILIQICEALDAAHKLGIVHRDLKPSNVMLVAGRSPELLSIKVLDFGLTKWLDDDTPASLQTRPGDFLGTPAFASPEQALGQDVDHRSDLYSLGVMAYELLSGRRPFGGTLYALLKAHCETLPTPLSALGLDLNLPQTLESLVLLCLAKKPEERPHSALSLAKGLMAVRDELACL